LPLINAVHAEGR